MVHRRLPLPSIEFCHFNDLVECRSLNVPKHHCADVLLKVNVRRAASRRSWAVDFRMFSRLLRDVMGVF